MTRPRFNWKGDSHESLATVIGYQVLKPMLEYWQLLQECQDQIEERLQEFEPEERAEIVARAFQLALPDMDDEQRRQMAETLKGALFTKRPTVEDPEATCYVPAVAGVAPDPSAFDAPDAIRWRCPRCKTKSTTLPPRDAGKPHPCIVCGAIMELDQ